MSAHPELQCKIYPFGSQTDLKYVVVCSFYEGKLNNPGFVAKAPEKLVAEQKQQLQKVLEKIGVENILMFYPDEGAMKRYSSMFDCPYAFGIKKRDWATGQIQGLEVSGQKELVEGSTILIVDDICSKGGTFYHSAKALKELGAGKIYLYISHCENTIFEGEILKDDLIERVFTTNSIFTNSDG